MTNILNFLTHIGNYAGIGMIIAAVGIAITLTAIIKLSKLKKKSRRVSRAEFNRGFVRDTGMNISDVDEGALRRAAVQGLGIGNGRR